MPDKGWDVFWRDLLTRIIMSGPGVTRNRLEDAPIDVACVVLSRRSSVGGHKVE